MKSIKLGADGEGKFTDPVHMHRSHMAVILCVMHLSV